MLDVRLRRVSHDVLAHVGYYALNVYVNGDGLASYKVKGNVSGDGLQ